MSFTQPEIDLAHTLKADGLPWTPTVGHYVWDREHLIKHDSPFGGRIYFILELKHFLRRAESMAHLTESMVWLPTWEQARGRLRDAGISDADVSRHLQTSDAIASGNERIELYRLLHQHQTQC